MIRRDAHDRRLLISQVEHARLAADLAEAWRDPQLLEFPQRLELLSAIRHHDDGWAGWEQAPTLNADGAPRDFTEMPMPVATDIWSRSIDACAESEELARQLILTDFKQFLVRRGWKPTESRIEILHTILENPEANTYDGVVERLVSSEIRVSRATLFRTLTMLVEANIIEPLGVDLWDSGFRVTRERRRPSPSGGLWVSRHFSHLAEQARDSRTSTEDKQATGLFLDQQAALRDIWRHRLGWENSATAIEQLEETGFLWLQTFDRISLWFCCAERTDPYTITLPSGDPVTFHPHAGGSVVLDPFPFAAPEFRISIEGVVVPMQPFRDEQPLRVALAAAPSQTLQWRLTAQR